MPKANEQTNEEMRKNHARHRLLLRLRLLHLRPVEHLLELRDAEAHARVHVRLRALDVVVEVVAEELDVRDRLRGNVRVREVAREEDEGDVADVLGGRGQGEVPDLQGRLAVGVEDLGRGLDGGEPAGVDEFLRGCVSGGVCG